MSGLVSVPEGGWRERCYYVVEVRVSKSNVPHKAILYTGFLTPDGEPGSYSCLFNPTYDDRILQFCELYSLNVHSIIPGIGL